MEKQGSLSRNEMNIEQGTSRKARERMDEENSFLATVRDPEASTVVHAEGIIDQGQVNEHKSTVLCGTG